MLKSVQLKLLKIKYSGDSVGDDIRIEIEVLGKFLRIDKKIKAGTITDINKEIGNFETDQKSFEASLRITVIDKDLFFNDVGSANGSVKINTAAAKPQQFIFEVLVKETRSKSGKSWGKVVATFEITLEAEVSDAIRYIPDLDESQGFLSIKFEDSKSIESLPANLRIIIERADLKREYFKILEGPYRGRSASVGLKRDKSSRLIADVNHKSAIRAQYSISKKIFILNSKKYKTADYPSTPWQKGIYDIEIPDYFHEGGRNYLDRAKRAGTWFRIGHDGARYLHAGGFSRGCMTVIEVERWMEIYDTLIKARKGDFLSVGILKVID